MAHFFFKTLQEFDANAFPTHAGLSFSMLEIPKSETGPDPRSGHPDLLTRESVGTKWLIEPQTVEEIKPLWRYMPDVRPYFGAGAGRVFVFNDAKGQYFGWLTKSRTHANGFFWHGSASFIFRKETQIDLFELWRALLKPVGAKLGHLHLNSEREDPYVGREKRGLFSVGISNRGQLLYIPELPWASFIGGHWAEQVDYDAIRSAGFPIERWEGGYIVRVTEDIKDLERDIEAFHQKRLALKKLLPQALFEYPRTEKEKAERERIRQRILRRMANEEKLYNKADQE